MLQCGTTAAFVLAAGRSPRRGVVSIVSENVNTSMFYSATVYKNKITMHLPFYRLLHIVTSVMLLFLTVGKICRTTILLQNIARMASPVVAEFRLRLVTFRCSNYLGPMSDQTFGTVLFWISVTLHIFKGRVKYMLLHNQKRRLCVVSALNVLLCCGTF